MLIILPLLVGSVLSLFCNTPQRTGFMSYETLSGYDNMTGLFRKINLETQNESCPGVQLQNVTYSLTNIKPQLYYQDAKQKSTYIDKFTANVTGGVLYFAYQLSYEITYQSNKTAKGTASTYNRMPDFWFTKTLVNEKGQLSWKIGQVMDLQLDDPFFVDDTNPRLPFDDRLQVELILSGVYPECAPKHESFPKLNVLFKTQLQNFLQDQDLLSTSNLKYEYKPDRVIQYANLPSQFGLTEKGLQWEFLFEVDNFTTKCGEVPTNFSQGYGGHQEYIAMEQVVATAQKALIQKWFDGALGSHWEIEQFQFYMGDVANYIPKANNHAPDEAITVDCRWNNSLYNITIEPYSSSRLSVTTPFTCTLTANQTKIQTINLGVTMQLLIDATRDYLVVTNTPFAGVFGLIYQSENGYVVQKIALADYCVKNIVRSYVGTKTLGTNFPISRRTRPGIKVTGEYILIFDSAQP